MGTKIHVLWWDLTMCLEHKHHLGCILEGYIGCLKDKYELHFASCNSYISTMFLKVKATSFIICIW